MEQRCSARISYVRVSDVCTAEEAMSPFLPGKDPAVHTSICNPFHIIADGKTKTDALLLTNHDETDSSPMEFFFMDDDWLLDILIRDFGHVETSAATVRYMTCMY